MTGRPASERLGLGRRREQDVRGDAGDEVPGGPAATGEERTDRGQVEAHLGARRRGPARSPAGPTRRAAIRAANRRSGGAGPTPANQSALRSSGPSCSAAPRSVTKLRSPPPGATTTPIRPVLAPATRTTRIVTPSASSALTRARPAASRPTAAMRLLRAPSRASQRAVVAADPPCTIETWPTTSVPSAIASLGATHDVEDEVAEDDDPRLAPPSRLHVVAAGTVGRDGAGGWVVAGGWPACRRAYRPR